MNEKIINVPLKLSTTEWLETRADDLGRATCREAAKIIEDEKRRDDRRKARA